MFKHLLCFVGVALAFVSMANTSALAACADNEYAVTYDGVKYNGEEPRPGGDTLINRCAPCIYRSTQNYYIGGYKRCLASGLECESPYEMHLIFDGWRDDYSSGVFFYHNTCKCTAADTYVGYNNKCFDCPDNRYNDYTCSNDGDGNTTFECNNIYEYKVAYTNSSSGRYGEYTCVRCPEIKNCSDFDVGGYHESCLYSGTDRGVLIWEERTEPSKRCNGTRNGTLTDWFESKRKKCEYTITDIKPESGCTWYNNTDEIPSYESLVYVSDGCNYTFKKNYSSASAGYGVTNNNTQNATCGPCPSGKYSTEGSTTCLNPPANATVNDTQDDFLCNVGYFRNGSVCSPCPADLEHNTTTPTTAGIGALSASECYINAANITEEHDQTGWFERTGVCPYGDNVFTGYYTLCMEGVTSQENAEACENALKSYYSEYEHLTNSGHGDLDRTVDGILHSNSFAPSDETCESVDSDHFKYSPSAKHTTDAAMAQAWLSYLGACSPTLRVDVSW